MDMTGEKTKGRKRHIVTDTMGNLLCIHVHAANIHDPLRRDVQMAVIEEHSGILLMNFTILELIFLCK